MIQKHFRTYRRIVVFLLFAVISGNNCQAQLRWADELIENGRKIKPNKVDRVADFLENLKNSKIPISALKRDELGISLQEAAALAFQKFPDNPTTYRIYIGKVEGDFSYTSPGSKPNEELMGHINEIRTNDPLAEIEVIVEVEFLDEIKNLDGLSDDIPLFLANFSGEPWKISKMASRNSIVIEVNPSLLIENNDNSFNDFLSFSQLKFDPQELKVVSLFDEAADFTSINAVKKNSKHNTNITNKEGLISLIKQEKGRIIAIVGHVENDSYFVIHNKLGKEISRIPIHELQQLAEKKQTALLMMGCETGKLPHTSGPLKVVNSFDVAAQLERSLQSKNYFEFFTSLGTPQEPFIISQKTIGQTHNLIIERINKGNVKEKTVIKTVIVSPKLSAGQVELEKQLFKTIPKWFNDIIILFLFISFCVLVLSYLLSSFKPIKIYLSLLFVPFVILGMIYKSLTRPPANPDRVN